MFRTCQDFFRRFRYARLNHLWGNLEEINEVLNRMEISGLQENIQKSKWSLTQEKCLCIVSTNGHSPDPKKTHFLVTMKHSKNKREAQRFLGGTNFYRKMRRNHSHTLVPLTALTGNVAFMWSETNQEACDEIKDIMSKETMLHHPNYDLSFLTLHVLPTWS